MSCSDGDSEPSASSVRPETETSRVGETADDRFPSVVAVDAEQNDDGTWDFSVTMTSPYDTPER